MFDNAEVAATALLSIIAELSTEEIVNAGRAITAEFPSPKSADDAGADDVLDAMGSLFTELKFRAWVLGDRDAEYALNHETYLAPGAPRGSRSSLN